MKNPSAPKTVQVNIRSGEDLARALRHPDMNVRTMVLRAITERPDQAMNFKTEDGGDLIDDLLRLCRNTLGSMERIAYAYTLLSLNDSRVIDFAKTEFTATDNHKIALLCAGRLSKLPEEEKARLLSPVVTGDYSPTRVRMAANLLTRCKNLPPEVSVRVAIMSDQEMPVPSLDADNPDTWLKELCGPFPRTARELLLKYDGKSVNTLLSLWDRLPEEIRVWTIREGIKNDIPGVSRTVEKIIQAGEEKPLKAAIESIRDLPDAGGYETLLRPLYTHENPSVRALAISAGAERGNWSAALMSETSPEVRTAIIRRIGRCGGADDVTPLIRVLSDGNWRIRAQAADALTRLAPDSLPHLRKALESVNENTRTAAAQALYKLGFESWVKTGLADK